MPNIGAISKAAKSVSRWQKATDATTKLQQTKKAANTVSRWGTKSGMRFTDDQLAKTQQGLDPRNPTRIEMWDVDDLIDEHVRILQDLSGSSREELIQDRLNDTETMNELRRVFLEEGNMDLPALWKPGAVGEREGQEGLHRTLVAKELGMRKVPVVVVDKAKREELEPLPLPEVVEE